MDQNGLDLGSYDLTEEEEKEIEEAVEEAYNLDGNSSGGLDDSTYYLTEEEQAELEEVVDEVEKEEQ